MCVCYYAYNKQGWIICTVKPMRSDETILYVQSVPKLADYNLLLGRILWFYVLHNKRSKKAKPTL